MQWRYQIVLTMGKSCRRSCDYVRLVVLRDPFLVVVFFEAAFFAPVFFAPVFFAPVFFATVFFATVFFATVFFATVFFDATFRVADLASMAWCLGEISLGAPFGSVVVSNS
jgi:hypothetical protein